jgi:hypothetical protein
VTDAEHLAAFTARMDEVWAERSAATAARMQRYLLGPVATSTTSTTNPVHRWIHSVDPLLREVRVADVLGGTPGPWEPLAAYTYPHGAYPGRPANPVALVATSTSVYLPWYAPGYVYADPPLPDPEPPTERAPEPPSEWCCGGTCLRVNCDYHGPNSLKP